MGTHTRRTAGRQWWRRFTAAAVLCTPLAAAAVAAPAGAAAPSAGAEVAAPTGGLVTVIVRELPGAGDGPERAVERLGGEVGRHIGVINGFVAELPSGALPRLRVAAGVLAATPDASVEVSGYSSASSDTGTGETLYQLVRDTQAKDAWSNGRTGQGIDVALIDTGVTQVAGLDQPGKVVYGPDLSFDGQDATWQNKDGYGHGTHLAGIIAGRDAGVASGAEASAPADKFLGVAPSARLISVKAGDRNGVVDVSQVLAAIDWVVQNRTANGMNIRVLNLAFGTNGNQDYRYDPLTYAVEVAWRKGIVVVAAAGNAGTSLGSLTNPAIDPFIVAVGANDTKGTSAVSDDTVPDWSSRGNGVRNPDLLAPGKSVVSLLAPGSRAAIDHAEAAVGTRFMKGSGTSQAAAVISGMAALYLQKYPLATPDQVKAAMRGTASVVPAATVTAQGQGMVRGKAFTNSSPSATALQTFTPALGTGSLEQARGDAHVAAADGTVLQGEVTVNGSSWAGSSWAGSSWAGSSWAGSSWAGSSWAGSSWAGSSWAGSSWAGNSWAGSSWAGGGWLGAHWG